jgi:hypothetical protein
VPDPHPRHREGADLPVELAQLVDLIAERLETRTRQRWVGADVVADHLGVEVSYVYEHADELGARRLGSGPKARLRFRLDLVDEALDAKVSSAHARPTTPTPTRRRRRHSQPRTHVPLLPIRQTGTNG